MADKKTTGALGGAASGAATGAAVGSVVPGIGTAIGAGVGGIIGGVAGYLSAAAQESDEKKRQKLLEAAKAEFDQIALPEEKAIVFEQLKQQGLYTPETEQVFTQGDTEMGNISIDPRIKQAQLDALAQLQGLGKEGLNLQDKLDIQRSRMDADQQSSNAQAQIQDALARRGVASSGMNMVQRQMAAQNAANQSRDYEAQIQARAQQRALEAIMNAGGMAGNIRGQEWSEKSEAARAQDAINRYNTMNTQQVSGGNVDRRNQAQQANLSERQRIADANAGIKNAEMLRQAGGDQRRFENQLAVTQAKNGATGQLANMYGDRAQGTANQFGGLIQGGTQAVGAYAQSKNRQDTLDFEKQKWEDEKALREQGK